MALVMYGGVIAAALGPFAAIVASDAVDKPYVGSCVLIAILGVAALILAATMPPATGGDTESDKPAIQIRDRLRNPRFQQAILVLAGSGFVMTLVMAAGPLANEHAGHGLATGAAMIQWHLLGMFAPSALSALFLKRFGIFKTNITGGLIMVAGSTLGICADSGWAMTVTLALVGVGWNVLFIAGSALLLKSYPQGRGTKLQGFTDGATAAISATGSFAAAWILQSIGWTGVNLLAVAVTATILLLLAWSTRRMGKPPAPRQDADDSSAVVVAETTVLETSTHE